MPHNLIPIVILAAVILIAIFFCAALLDISAVKSDSTTDKPEEQNELKCAVIYDVPLGRELQIFTQNTCERYGIEYELVLAIIQVESGFNPNAYNVETDCIGLMQVKSSNLPELIEELDVNYLYDPFDNILGGVYLLRKAFSYDCNTEHALMIYNNGLTGARKLWADGIHLTEYTRKVLAAKDELKVRERIYEEVQS